LKGELMRNRPKGVVAQRSHFLEGCKHIVSVVGAACDSPPDILGVDPARGTTGLCLRTTKDKIILKKITPKFKGFSKVIDVEKGVRKILNNYNPLIAIEGYAMNARFGRELAGELGGVLRRLFFFKKRPMLVVAPLSLKAWVKAKSKDQVMMEILDRYGLKIPSNDIADAFVLQEIAHKAVLLSKQVVKDKVSADDVRLYLKDGGYKKGELKSLYRYQEGSLYRLILAQGTWIEFYNRNSPEEDYEKEKENKSSKA